MSRLRTKCARLAACLALVTSLCASAAAVASEPCLVFVHGKRNSGVEDWNDARDSWRSGSRDFVEKATRGFTAPHYVVSYHPNQPWWHVEAAGDVAAEIVAATDGLPDGGGNVCPSWQSGGRFWLIAHSMGASILDYILGNADPSSENYNANGPYDVAADRIDLAITLGGTHRGSQLADAACGDSSLVCDLGGSLIQGCTDANFWLRSDEGVQVRSSAGSPARSVYLTGGYEAIFGASLCLAGEDDGLVQYASQYACSGSADVAYDNGDVCGNGAKQESLGFQNLDGSHENHANLANDTDRDTRRAIPDGVWRCGGSPCSPDATVQSSMSAAQLVSTLATQGFAPNASSGGGGCGLGPGLALLLPLLGLLRHRRT